jgi:hypothetical protein
VWFLFAFLLWPGMVSISSCVFVLFCFVFSPVGLLPLKISVQFSCSLFHWVTDFGGSLVF